MTSPNQTFKTSKVAKMRVRPLWKRKIDYCHNKPNSQLKNASNQHTSTSSLHDHTNEWPIDNTSMPNNSSNYFPTYASTQTTNQPYVEPRLHVETTLFNENQTLPKNPTFDEVKYLEELKQYHELNALLAMHLAQNNLNQPPGNSYSPDLPNALNKEQVSCHTYYCPCCQFLLKHMVDLSDQMNWLEYLITRPLLPLPTSSNPQPKSHSAPLSPSTTN